MPQISPIMWPIVVTTLILLLITIKSSMENISAENQLIQTNLSINENNWNW